MEHERMRESVERMVHEKLRGSVGQKAHEKMRVKLHRASQSHCGKQL